MWLLLHVWWLCMHCSRNCRRRWACGAILTTLIVIPIISIVVAAGVRHCTLPLLHHHLHHGQTPLRLLRLILLASLVLSSPVATRHGHRRWCRRWWRRRRWCGEPSLLYRPHVLGHVHPIVRLIHQWWHSGGTVVAQWWHSGGTVAMMVLLVVVVIVVVAKC